MFGRKKHVPPQFDLTDYIAIFEVFLYNCGVDPIAARILWGEDGVFGWTVVRGSARNFLFLVPDAVPADSLIVILSPIARIPQSNLLPFYRRCLELNGMMTVGALGVHHDILFVIQRRFLLGIEPVGLAAEFDAVTEAADAIDDMLMDEFGARHVGQLDFDWLEEVL